MRSAAARSQINGLAALKCTPKALTWGIFARVDHVLHDDLDGQNEPGDDGQCRNKRHQIGAQDLAEFLPPESTFIHGRSKGGATDKETPTRQRSAANERRGASRIGRAVKHRHVESGAGNCYCGSRPRIVRRG